MDKVVVVRGGHLLTMGPAGDVEDGAVAFAGGEVLAAGPSAEVRASFPGAEVVGDDHGVVLPGLVNAHTHLSEGLIPGMGEELTLLEWLAEIVTPVGRHLTREMAMAGAMLKGAELLLSGVTCVNDMFCHTNSGSLASLGAVDGLEAMGLRGLVAYGAEDAVDAQPVATVLAEHQALAERCAASPGSGSASAWGRCSARATSCWPPRPPRPGATAGPSTPTWPRSGRRSWRPACGGGRRPSGGPPRSGCSRSRCWPPTASGSARPRSWTWPGPG